MTSMHVRCLLNGIPIAMLLLERDICTVQIIAGTWKSRVELGLGFSECWHSR